MRAVTAAAVALVFVAGVVTGERWHTPAGAQGFSVTMECGISSAAKIRTTGFPDGLTVWQAEGQWLTPVGSIDREQSKVLLLVHADTAAARQSVQEVIQAYRKSFEQESVLWENSRVCVAS